FRNIGGSSVFDLSLSYIVGDAGNGGTIPASGIQSPVALTAGHFILANAYPDLAVAGSNGLWILSNITTTVGGNASFSLKPKVSATGNLISLTTSLVDAGTLDDIVGITSANQVIAFNNDAFGAFIPTTVAVAAGTKGKVIAADLDGDGHKEILVTSADVTIS